MSLPLSAVARAALPTAPAGFRSCAFQPMRDDGAVEAEALEFLHELQLRRAEILGLVHLHEVGPEMQHDEVSMSPPWMP